MKDNHNIEDWYRNELENYHVPPEANSWDKLSEQLNHEELLTDEKMDEWYKKELEKVESQPDYAVWEKLSTCLDTASVWEKLAVTLTRYERVVWWRNTLLKTAALLLFFAGLTVTINNNSAYLTQEGSHTVNDASEENLLLRDAQPTGYSAFFSGIIEQKTTVEETTPAYQQTTTTVVTPITNKRTSKVPTDNNLIASKSSSFDVDAFSSNSLAINTDFYQNTLTKTLYAKEFLIKKEKDKIIFNNRRFSSNFAFGIYAKRFYVGINAGLKKQGMLTKVNPKGVLSNYTQQTLLDYGSSVGATLGMVVSDKLNVETNINYSTNGFRKKYINEEQTLDERLSLSYANISVLAKRTFNKSTFDSKTYSTNVVGGVYVGLLTSSSSKINNTITENRHYQHADMGIVLGIEQDRYITKEFIITPGIRYYQGLKNSVTQENPLSSGYNYSVEFNLGLKYIFLKRK